MGFGPARAPTKAPYRSPVKSLALEVTTEPPTPPTTTYLCYHGEIIEKQPGLNCGDTTNPDCTGAIKGDFPGELQVRWNFFGGLSTFNYKNFPVDVIDPTTELVYATIPWLCDNAAWPTTEDGTFYVGDPEAYGYQLELCDPRVPSWGRCFLLTLCSRTDFGGPAFGEKVSFEIQIARWNINSIVGIDIDVGFNALRAGDHVKITGTPGGVNDRGILRVLSDSLATDFISVDEVLTNQGAGGTVELLVAGWQRCYDYQSLELPAPNYHPAILESVGVFGGNTVRIRLSGAGVYNGDHPIDLRGADVAELVGQLWTSRIETGSWINDVLKIGAPGHSVGSGTMDGRIVGTVNYDGLYTFEFLDVNTLLARDTWYLGNETGEIQYQSVFGIGTGIEAGWSGPITITVSGTTSYNGTWNTNAQDLGGIALFIGGDFDAIWGIGDESGAWVEVGGLGRSGTIDISPNNGPDAITGFAPEANGSVKIIDSFYIRANAVGVDAQIGGGARLWTNSTADPPPYFSDPERNIGRTGPGWIEISGLFSVTDDGRLTVRDVQ